MRLTRSLFALALMFAAGYVVGQFSRADLAAQGSGQKVFELRTYYTLPASCRTSRRASAITRRSCSRRTA